MFGISRKKQGLSGIGGFPAVAEVGAHWNALCTKADVPFRQDVDPRCLESSLKNTFILEKIAPGMARLRVAGAELNDLLGMEVRGMPVSSLIAPESRDVFKGILNNVFERPARADLRLTAPFGLGKSGLEARMVLLPLRSSVGDVTRILGCLEYKGNAGYGPRRFTIQGSFVRSISGANLQENGKTSRAALNDVRIQPTQVPYLGVVMSDT